MRRIMISVLVLCGLSCALHSAKATYLPEVIRVELTKSKDISEGYVTLSGSPALSIAIPVSHSARLEAISKNFRKALYEADDIPKAWVKGGTQPTVMAGEAPLFTVTDLDIKLWKQKGTAWPEGVMGQLNKALQSLPSMGDLPSKIYLPISEIRHFTLMKEGDQAAYSLSMRVDDPLQAFEISISEEGSLSIKGVKGGEGWIYLTKGALQREIWIKTRYMAGMVAGSMMLFLSQPLPARDEIETFARSAIATHVFEREGASTTLQFSFPPELKPGSQFVPVKVVTKGQDYFDFIHQTHLEVRVQALTRMQPKMLYMSNSPERVKAPQRLFEGTMDAGAPVRFMLHHLNDTSRKLLYSLKVQNTEDTATAVFMQGAWGGPSPHETALGFALGKRFFANTQAGKGMGLTVPPQSTAVLWRMKANVKDVVSLLMNMEAVGGKLKIVVDARYADGLMSQEDVIDNHHPELVFSYTNTHQEVQHLTSQSWKYVTLGHLPPESGANQKHIRGNFGGMEDISIEIENDEEIDRKVWIKFDPAAGYAGALFMFNGKLMEVRPTSTREDLVIYKDVLPPGEKRSISIKSLTLPGSNYPAKLIVAAEPRPKGARRPYE